MKKKLLMALLVTAMTAGAFTGCGNRMEGEGRVQVAMAEAESSQGEDDGSSESETPESEPEATAKPTAEPESSTISEAEASENDENAVEAGLGAASGYTFNKMDEVTMYTKTAVNVRDLPATDGKLVVRLTDGDEVVVTGQCVETGSAAAAFYEVDGYYWVVFLAYRQVSAPSAEEWIRSVSEIRMGIAVFFLECAVPNCFYRYWLTAPRGNSESA